MLEPAKTWTDEMVEMLRKCISEGKSASVIASEISLAHGRMVSRNSIIGKAHRLNINVGENSSIKMKTDPAKRSKPKIKKTTNKPLPTFKAMPVVSQLFKNPAAKGVKFLDLKEGVCKYPTGDIPTKNLRFCGAPADSQKSKTYCRFCYPILYIPSRPPAKITKLHR
jgi:GcrA cell cycle regulator